MQVGGTLVLILSLWAAAFAQLNSPPASEQTNPRTIAGDPASRPNQLMVVLNGKVLSEDNTPPSGPGSVAMQCGLEIRARSELDSKGNFTLTLAGSDGSSKPPMAPGDPPGMASSEWIGCELYADLPGYRSEHIRLETAQAIGVVDVGTILVHPLAIEDQAFTVSAISLAAPDKAKKAFQKGRDQERKGRWAAACQYFKRAIAVYPRYALAWLELGRSEVRQNSFRDAQQSFEQAVKQDPHLRDGYAELAQLALRQQNWKALADASGSLLELSPDAGPQYWFLNSAAHFNLNQIPEAEAAITRGSRLDPKHRVPQMEYLYGLILARKKDYRAATEHIRAYLRLSPGASDADRARRTLDELVRFNAAAESGKASSGH